MNQLNALSNRVEYDAARYPVPKSLQQPAFELEQAEPLSRKVREFFRMGGADPNSTRANSAWSLKRFLSENSSLWGFGRAVKNRLLRTEDSELTNDLQLAAASLTPQQMEYASVFEGADWRTILTSRYRAAAEDNDDPRIRVGYWLTEWAIQHINDLSKRHGIRSIFVLLPTKESAFALKVHETEGHKYFSKLTTDENLHRRRLIEFMDKADIGYVDTAPALRSSSAQPYHESADGHPNQIGNEIIASRLLKDIGTCD